VAPRCSRRTGIFFTCRSISGAFCAGGFLRRVIDLNRFDIGHQFLSLMVNICPEGCGLALLLACPAQHTSIG
jgi:hypothetical protein